MLRMKIQAIKLMNNEKSRDFSAFLLVGNDLLGECGINGGCVMNVNYIQSCLTHLLTFLNIYDIIIHYENNSQIRR